MKSTFFSLLVLTSLLATLTTRSQIPTADFDPLGEINDLPRMVRIQAEFIEMSHPTYTKLMAKPRTSANDADLRAECAKLVAADQAGVLETMCVTALPGQNATSESIAEYIYPTEYEPGEVPDKINGDAAPGDTLWGSPPTPTAFDIRNLGSTFEVEPMIDVNGLMVEVRFRPTIVYHVDTINWGSEKTIGAAGPIETPTFYTLQLSSGTILVSGEPSMVAALSPKNDKGLTDTSRKIIIFLRADILTVGK